MVTWIDSAPFEPESALTFGAPEICQIVIGGFPKCWALLTFFQFSGNVFLEVTPCPRCSILLGTLHGAGGGGGELCNVLHSNDEAS